MLKKEKIDRINHLAKKSKGEEGLTEEEKKEQEQLRKEYIEKFREHFKGHLNRVKFVEDLSEEELAKIQKENAQIQKEREKNGQNSAGDPGPVQEFRGVKGHGPGKSADL